ncbi:MAG: chemotaxis protein CheX [Pyrinomonadaceae bacterium]|nr:chemotaxis protein CheX [Pyrinomonadaceae bacterium]
MLISEPQTAHGKTWAFEEDNQVPFVLIEETERSTVESFTKICGEISILEDDEVDLTHCMKIDGIISFVGDLTWSLIMVLPHDSAEMMAKKFAGFDIPFESEDMGDVVGELTNVLAGVLCGNLEDAGIRSQMSLPTVTRGSDFEFLTSESLLTHQSHFAVGEYDFMIRLIVAKHR